VFGFGFVFEIGLQREQVSQPDFVSPTSPLDTSTWSGRWMDVLCSQETSPFFLSSIVGLNGLSLVALEACVLVEVRQS